MPGHTVFTRTPCGARSRAMQIAKLMFAAFDALYGGSVGEPTCPATDAMKIIVPLCLSTIPGAIACATFTIPMTLMFKTRGQSVGVKFVNGKPNLPDAAAAA